MQSLLFWKGSTPASGRTELLSEAVLKALHAGVNWSGLEADQSVLSCSQIKKAWRFISTLPLSML